MLINQANSFCYYRILSKFGIISDRCLISITENVIGDTVSGYFDNYGVINAKNFNLTVGGTFYNSIQQ